DRSPGRVEGGGGGAPPSRGIGRTPGRGGQAGSGGTRSVEVTAALIGDGWLSATTTRSSSHSSQNDATRSATTSRLSPPGGANAPSRRHRAMTAGSKPPSGVPSHSP